MSDPRPTPMQPFKNRFKEAVVTVARLQDFFSTIDIWPLVGSSNAHDNRSVGVILSELEKEGAIERTDRFTTGDGVSGGSRTRSPIRVWRSKLRAN